MVFGQVHHDGLQLPSWVDPTRLETQLGVAEEIVDYFAAGAQVVILDAPTGCGKTLIGEIVRQRMTMMGWPTKRGGIHRSVYTCTDRELQRQVASDFPYAKMLMGKENYPTLDHPDVTCDLCTKRPGTGCKWCSSWLGCPYQVAKRGAATSELMVTNLSYLLREANSGERSVTGGRDFIILDECDQVENWLGSTIEVNVSAWMRRRLNLGVPKKKTVATSWQAWIEEELIPRLELRWQSLEGTEDPKELKEQRSLERMLDSLDGIDVGDNWVYDGYQGYKDGKHPVIFRPVHVDRFASSMLWRHAPHVLMMSATVISPAQMAIDLGLEPHQWASVQMDSPFDPARSPIQVRPVANMSRKADERGALLAELEDIIQTHPGQRILVHTVSYDLTRWLQRYLTSGRVMSYDSARGKEAALRRYRDRGDSVMLAPSLDRGISMDDDLARVNVVAKIPFPSLGDKRVAARLYSRGGDTWYAVETVRTLIQACGRASRSKEDWSKGVILDQQFISNIWSKSRHLLPVWFRKRLDMSGRKEPVKV